MAGRGSRPRWGETVDLVHEQHAVRLEVGEDRGEITGAFQDRSRVTCRLTPISAAMMYARVVLPEAGRAKSSTWSSDSARERAAVMNTRGCGDLLLADVLDQAAGPQALLEASLGRIARGSQHVLRHAAILPFRPARWARRSTPARRAERRPRLRATTSGPASAERGAAARRARSAGRSGGDPPPPPRPHAPGTRG